MSANSGVPAQAAQPRCKITPRDQVARPGVRQLMETIAERYEQMADIARRRHKASDSNGTDQNG
jgi:hypothetical protein